MAHKSVFPFLATGGLSTSGAELSVSMITFTSKLSFRTAYSVAHKGVGRVARTNVFEVMFRAREIEESKRAAPHARSSQNS